VPAAGATTKPKVAIAKPANSGAGKVFGIGCLSIVGIVVILTVIGAINSPPSTSSDSGSEATAAPVGSIRARDLVSAYSDNEVSADSQFKGQRYRVSGTIDSIGKDILDSPYVTLGSGTQFEVNTVQAMFKRNRDEGILANLSKGQDVSVECEIKGKVLLNVLADNCVLAP